MSKTPQKSKPQNSKPTNKPQAGKSNLPARVSSAGGALSREGVSNKVLELAKKNAGAGTSSDASDNIVPFIYVLQSLSPVALPKNPAYIEGAEAGDFWLKNAPDPIVKADEGFEFQPVSFSKCWIQWKPERGGFVAKHATKPAEAEWVEDKKGNGQWEMPNGDIVQETREVAGLVLGMGAPMPYVITFKGSGHTVAKSWNTTCRNKVDPDDGFVWPCYAFSYRLTTQYRSNDKGDWYIVKVDEGEDLRGDEAAFTRGHVLQKAFESGEKRAADEYDDEADDTGDGDI